jgi:hypothetical protein
MSPETKAVDRGELVTFQDVPGWVVLLDADMNEVVGRQECKFSWVLIRGGATYSVTTDHDFDIQGKSVTYMGVGFKDQLLFVSVVAGHPVEHSATMSIR